ncbi:hypothetical protein ACFOSD_15715 [Salinispirillum marinum]|uniref:Uncharacterized protein n=2 Tax=Saccharospirillaceae TaxID=255527 RepID=A0ABV8BK84_9GAMM
MNFSALRSIASLFHFVILSIGAVGVAFGSENDLNRHIQEVELGYDIEFVFNVNDEIELGGYLMTTEKGNGFIRLGESKSINVIDYHNDGEYFLDGRAAVYVADLNLNSFYEIIVVGVLVKTNEQDGSFSNLEPYLKVYAYDGRGYTDSTSSFISGQ